MVLVKFPMFFNGFGEIPYVFQWFMFLNGFGEIPYVFQWFW